MTDTTQTIHTPLPWSVGRTLSTAQTRRWSKDQRAMNDATEACLIFSNFRGDDEGRSRALVAQVFDSAWDHEETESNARFIVTACNNHEALLKACKLMYEALHQLMPCLKHGVVQDYELVLTTAPRACAIAIADAERTTP